MTDRGRERRNLRRMRRALDPDTRRDAALAIARHLANELLIRRLRTVGAFVAADGEADPGPFIAAARLRGRRIFLPVLAPLRPGSLLFRLTDAGQALAPNRYGIPEPVAGAFLDPRFLDAVLVPLVGFDCQGNRLGMGAGYYDRTFSYLRTRSGWRKPRLIGIAFDCQRVASIDAAPWDIPLDGVATESGLYWFK